MTQMTLAEQVIYSTVKLTAFKNGLAFGNGTGFFYHFAKTGTKHYPTIVTNKHVISGADTIRATCHIANQNPGPSGKFINLDIPIHQLSVVNHPSPDVDLCALTIAPLLTEAFQKGTPVFYVCLDSALIPQTEDWQYYDAIENVTMIGCPNGISDEANNIPIVRRGITASSLTRNYNNKSEFVVDMACFPGSSGSPVFVLDQNGYQDRKTNQYMFGAGRINLVGILYAGPLITNTGTIVLAQPPRVEIAAMMHLGYCIKSTQLNTLDAIFAKMN